MVSLHTRFAHQVDLYRLEQWGAIVLAHLEHLAVVVVTFAQRRDAE